MTSTGVTGAPLLVQHRDGLDVLTLNRPEKANALNREVLELVEEAVLRPSPGARAILLRATGPVFSGGVDLADATVSTRPPDARPVQTLLGDVVDAIEGSPLPVVALVHGSCVGGSVELALACDMRVATQAATFWIPATRIGVVYRAQGVVNIARRLAPGTVRQLLLLGMKFDSSAAERAGIVDMIVEVGTDVADPVAHIDGALTRLTDHTETFAAQKSVLRLWSRGAAVPADVTAQMTRVRNDHDARRRRGQEPSPAGSST